MTLPSHPPGDGPERPGSPTGFGVVGIGASAGGLEAFTRLLEGLPQETGLAFILVQHLDPHHQSQLGELLARVTRMPVLEATEGLEIRRNHAYVIPPNTDLGIDGGLLRVTRRGDGHRPHLAVDHFFRSLAKELGPRAIGVVLSGTGSDGTLGLAEIKASGGITFAQDRDSARHANMPASAVESGAVDFVLPPEEIAHRLAEIGGHPYLAAPEAEPEDDAEAYRRILNAVRQVTGVDFTMYRDTTIRRRIARRMALHSMPSTADYAAKLATDRAEVEALYRDVLINVTSFFRDPELFAQLKDRVFPGIVGAKAARQPIRIWVPGCSTGQEAYSIAMALEEFLEDRPFRPDVQIFATDLSDPTALDKARAGIYPDSIEEELTPERLRRFFRKEDHTYRIEKRIREACIFARQNLAADPPFSHLDLISCRNVLIYMSPELQRQVLPTFHIALDVPGFLVLGPSETVGNSTDLFEQIDRSHRIYAKRAAASRSHLQFKTPTHAARLGRMSDLDTSATGTPEFLREADRILVGRYVPPSVLVDADFEALQFRGDTNRFLNHPPGDPTNNLLKMAREGLFLDLRGALEEARRTNLPAVRPRVHLRDRDGIRQITARVLPIKPTRADRYCYLILFEEPSAEALPQETTPRTTAATPRGPAAPLLTRLGRRLFGFDDGLRGTPAAGPETEPSDQEQEAERLRHELTATREYVQSIIEQQDAGNEELRSANEEILSSNEELQSTNEELETAKEELQSANEELTTVNEQLQDRNVELAILGNDLSNLLSSTGIPVVMVGSDLRVRRVTPGARKVLNLLPTDVGRPIGEIRPSLSLGGLEPLIYGVIERIQPFEQEVQDSDGRWWILRIFPYRTSDNKIDGAVACLIDVDAVKGAQEELREALDYTEAIVQTTHEPLLLLDSDLRVLSANPAFHERFGSTAEGTAGQSVYSIGGRRLDLPALRELLGRVAAERRSVDDFVIELEIPEIGPRSFLLNARPIDEAGRKGLILLAIEDVTERQRRLEALTEAVEARDHFLAMISHELRNPLAAMSTATRVLKLLGGPASAEAQRAREALERQLEHLTRLVEDLLDVSRFTYDKIQLRRETVDLTQAIAMAADAARPAAEARGQELIVMPPTDPLYVEADPVRLEQILINLLSNAVRFNDAGGRVELMVEAQRDPPGPGRAVIRVRDDGIGLAPELQARMFDAFSQGGSQKRDGGTGLGLGLSLAKKLVELHGGTIQATSAGEGKGTEISVLLPLAADLPQEQRAIPKAVPGAGDAAAATIDGAATTGGAAAGKRRVLVVDDNRDAAQTLATLLRAMGHDAEFVHDGPNALQVFAADPPDVALIDIGLPGMSGYDVAREIRKLPAGRRATLVAHTGFAQEEDRERTLAAGFTHHLVKPVDWQALERLLDDLDGGSTGTSGP